MSEYYDEQGKYVNDGNPTAVDPTAEENLDDRRWAYARSLWVRSHGELLATKPLDKGV